MRWRCIFRIQKPLLKVCCGMDTPNGRSQTASLGRMGLLFWGVTTWQNVNKQTEVSYFSVFQEFGVAVYSVGLPLVTLHQEP
jgi:hypothetical protein